MTILAPGWVSLMNWGIWVAEGGRRGGRGKEERGREGRNGEGRKRWDKGGRGEER